jgi:hypothetical protein
MVDWLPALSRIDESSQHPFSSRKSNASVADAIIPGTAKLSTPYSWQSRQQHQKISHRSGEQFP